MVTRGFCHIFCPLLDIIYFYCFLSSFFYLETKNSRRKIALAIFNFHSIGSAKKMYLNFLLWNNQVHF